MNQVRKLLGSDMTEGVAWSPCGTRVCTPPPHFAGAGVFGNRSKVESHPGTHAKRQQIWPGIPGGKGNGAC